MAGTYLWDWIKRKRRSKFKSLVICTCREERLFYSDSRRYAIFDNRISRSKTLLTSVEGGVDKAHFEKSCCGIDARQATSQFESLASGSYWEKGIVCRVKVWLYVRSFRPRHTKNTLAMSCMTYGKSAVCICRRTQKLCSGAQRFCKEQVSHSLRVVRIVLHFGASERKRSDRQVSSFSERANKARNAAYHLSDMQRSLQEQRVYGGCLGFKKRWRTWYGCDKIRWGAK